jgi:hypothetical protein
MRKLLIVAVGLVTWLTALPLYAVDVNFSGEFRVRSFWSDNLFDGNSGSAGGFDDMSRFNDLRFRLKTSVKAGVTTGVVVLDFGNCLGGLDSATFQNGTNPAIPFPGFMPTGDCRFGTAGFGGSFNTVGVREAYVHIDLKQVGLILGRQPIKLGHGIVLDDTADAITVELPMGATKISASMLQIADFNDSLGFAVPSGVGINKDTTIWLVNVGIDQKSHVINLYDAFLYDQSPGTNFALLSYPTIPGAAFFVPGFADKIWVNYLGLSLDAKNGPLALAFEGTYDLGRAELAGGGKDIRLGGWNLMGDATADTGGAKVGGTVVYTSSQEPTAVNDFNVADISGNFQLGNILLNHEQTSDRDGGSLSGGFLGAGLFAVKLHADMMPTQKLTVGGAAIYALTPDRGICGSACERTIGYELDANAKYAVDDNLTFSAGAGYLVTANGARDFYSGAGGVANSNLWKLSAKAVFTF